MHHCDVLAWVSDGEVWCPDCCKPEDDDETVHPIFAGDERDPDDSLYCRGCDCYHDDSWGGWLKMDRRPLAVVALERIVNESR